MLVYVLVHMLVGASQTSYGKCKVATKIFSANICLVIASLNVEETTVWHDVGVTGTHLSPDWLKRME